MRAKQGKKTGCPHSDLCPPRYNVHTVTLDWHNGLVNLATTRGRIRVPFTLPVYAARYAGAKVCTADLVYRKGRFALHVVIFLPDVAFLPTGQALGVDLGICRPAVTSDNRCHGRKHWREVEKRTFRLLHSWSFAQLKGFLEYKAEELGCQVVGVDPRHTSQRCNACGHIYRGNRPSQSRFTCRSCGHRRNADFNAAENIRDRHLVGWSSPSGGHPSECLSFQSAAPFVGPAHRLGTSPLPLQPRVCGLGAGI